MSTRIPINKDSYNFEDRQKRIWEDMERDMEKRRREWEDEIDKMRSDFFHLRPENSQFAKLDGTGTLPRLSSHISGRPTETNDGKAVIEKDENGQPVFKVRFNMKDYQPEEVNVKMDSMKIMVSARHEMKGDGSTVSREYNREVNIPREVDPLALQCILNPDGCLVVHAPLPAPSYNAVKDSSSASHSPGILKSTSSYQTTSTVSPKPQSASVSSFPPTFPQQQQQQQQQVRTHVINTQQAPLSSGKPTTTFNQSKFIQDEMLGHPDHVVPTFKPQHDVSKLNMQESAPSRSLGQILHSTTSSNSHNSTFPKPPPFSILSSAFPSGPIFPESSTQAQLSVPAVTSHDGKFQLTMPIEDYRPEELTVKTQDKKVIISARREVSSGNRAQTMEMSREHSLPDNVDPLTVKAFFTDTNNLIVEAPFIHS
uniref:SHSP domain-containing protein n=1 Tax=Arion vulgaris TaxID=1028688 RepID=A0A0B7BLQ8_9EUPU